MNIGIDMTPEEIKQALVSMEQDDSLITKPNYVRTDTDIKMLSFREWHQVYLAEHPKINATKYLTNLRVMIKSRP